MYKRYLTKRYITKRYITKGIYTFLYIYAQKVLKCKLIDLGYEF